jgi:hypothetical protein
MAPVQRLDADSIPSGGSSAGGDDLPVPSHTPGDRRRGVSARAQPHIPRDALTPPARQGPQRPQLHHVAAHIQPRSSAQGCKTCARTDARRVGALPHPAHPPETTGCNYSDFPVRHSRCTDSCRLTYGVQMVDTESTGF